MEKMAKLITIEGPDGGGKSTQSKLIQEYLKEKGLSFQFFHFPMYGHNEFSELISRFLRGEFGSIDKVSPYFVANIYAMDRFMFLSDLNKALNQNQVVLLDRYVYSNIAYQGAKYPTLSEENRAICKWIYDFEFNFLKLPYPDLNIYFDVPMNIIKMRLEKNREGQDRDYLNGKQDIHEADLDFQSRVKDNYLNSMRDKSNCNIIQCAISTIDGYKVWSPEELFKNYQNLLDQVLSNTSL
jgi:dTMP kinase